MKAKALGLMFAAAIAVAGCPVYSNDRSYRVCDANACYDCSDTVISPACTVWSCSSSSDCPSNFSCTNARVCAPAASGVPGSSCQTPADCGANLTCGLDNKCYASNCTVVGCPKDYLCRLSSGVASCMALGPANDASVPTDGATSDGAPSGAQNADASSDASEVGVTKDGS